MSERTDTGADAPREPSAPDSHPDSPPTGPAQRLLRRSRDDRVIFGVAGGLGRYLGVDPVLVRIAFVVLALFGGSGLLLYLIGLIVIPEERPGEPVGADAPPAGVSGQNAAAILGGALIVVGTISLASRVVPALGDLLWPLVLVAAGVAVIVLGVRR